MLLFVGVSCCGSASGEDVCTVCGFESDSFVVLSDGITGFALLTGVFCGGS